ncbi:TonB family protein [Fulvivirgaceae bacterium PWU5]|uniref:TonB family protein n=1 Tax=Dawidia cretensis TaxID=2782350 RepID=A0AAP2E192_9BACT|nr:TonB family protein [Dawidia cretensis]MBT1709787.1 TonB family protein [Dawidia cretensis]
MANDHHDIERYLNGELSPAEMHALEKKALYDPFLAEALEGAAQLVPADLSADLQQLQASLRQASQKTTPGISLRVWALRIAATLLLLAVATAIIVRMVSTPDERLALQTPPPARQEAAAAPARPQTDSVVTSPPKPGVVASKPGDPTADESGSLRLNRAPEPTSTPGQVADAGESTDHFEEQQPVVAEVQEAPPAAPEAELKTEPADDREDDTRKRKSLAMQSADKDVETKKELAYTPSTLSGRVAGVSITRTADTLNDVTPPPTKTVHGKVTLSDDGTGIPGVNVMVAGTDQGTVTDINGNYHIRVEDEKNTMLAFSFIGMQSKEVPLGDTENVDVQLDQDVSQLSEVVVTGFGTDNGPLKEDLATFQLAVPAGGRGAYKQYLETNLHYPEQALANEVEGKVTIQFTVESSGRITDFKVLKGLGYGCDEEVIRLIKNGPKWQPSKRADEAVRDNVKVRLKFRLPKKK